MVVAFHETVEAYRTSTDTEDDHDVLEKLERLILDHTPQSIAEIVSMLGVIIPNVELGGRGDGADVAALENIQAYLQGLA
ncbi:MULTISPECIES: hypothetical protein [unclassified Brevundimonas]|uniref:hypothetical protein n=1 Tax=unclassified Brevundimonas TaxID=2622653 RepID=UPI000CFB94A5|nr:MULTISPECIES: hypothetical protein [unclassified Brevundimonas]PQZ84428.1 hypothetical protein CQ026_01090 [Brevundimonas sp. MYb31]PRB17663.1 hypothetical protein CQ039_01090 [Brevundimonas sp. MYb52]PRB38034.1 hypothetical protein CQ035_01090 [Brevundimonas sp. MYb46]